MSQHWSTPVRHLEIVYMEAFGTERACQQLAHLLDSTHCKLQSLIMTWSGTTAEGTSHIARALQANTSLIKLELCGCKVGDKGVEQLAAMLRNNSTIQELSLTVIGMTAEWTSHIARALQANTSLIKLNLADCDVGDKGVEQLAAMLRKNSTIQELSLGRIGMTGEGVGHLRDALVSQSQAASPPSGTGTGAVGLKMLDISDNNIGQAGAVHLGAILANNRCSLRNLIVKGCELEDEAGCLGKGLRTNNTLERLDIGGNSIGKKGMEALVRGLAANDTSALKILKMKVHWAEKVLPPAKLIASMITSNHSLEELDLSEAPYSATEWATIILPALGGNKTLTSIDLHYSDGLQGKQVEAAFFDLLRINTTIQTINLDGTPLSWAGKAEAIQEELRRKTNYGCTDSGNVRMPYGLGP